MISRFLSIFSLIRRILKGPGIAALVILVFLVILIWVFGPLVSISGKPVLTSFSARLSATFMLVFLWMLFMAIFKGMEGKAAAKNPEIAEAKKKLEQQRRAFKEESSYIRDKIKDAVKTVTSANYYGPASSSRYALPWYMVIGSENCGKTSALLNSGLTFPINEQADRGLYNIKATQRCQFLFSNQAVFIDTPGDYLNSGGDSKWSPWHVLLKELYKARPSNPLNGVVVCLSLRELVDVNADQYESIARAIRDRLNEISRKLGSSIPVYLLLTKCDAVPGFAEFFANLPRQEREQIFGGNNKSQEINPGQIRADLANLVHTLNSQVIPKVHHERNLGARGAIFLFPQELSKIAPHLEDFIYEAFGPSRYHQPAMFRGFYFSSALSAHDALAASSRQGEWSFQTGFQPSMGDYVKGFFLSSLFTNGIIPEAGLARKNEYKWHSSWGRYGAILGLLGVFALSGLVLASSFGNNYSRLEKLDSLAAEAKASQESNPAPNEARAILPELQTLEQSTEVYALEKDSKLRYGLGLYQGKKAAKATRGAYKQALNQRLQAMLRQQAAAQVERSLDNQGELKPALMAYLMLCLPDKLDGSFLASWQSEHWSRQYQGQADLQTQLKHQLNSLMNYGLESATPDASLLARARQALLKIPLADLAYQQLKSEAEIAAHPPFSFRRALGEQVSPFEGDTYAIPHLYTKNGFEQYLIKRCPVLIKDLTADSWIFGAADSGRVSLSDLDVNRIHKDVGLLFYRDYIQYWSEAVKALKVPKPSSLADAAKLADKMSTGSTPAVLILRELRANTTLVTDLEALNPEPKTAKLETAAEGEAAKEEGEAENKDPDAPKKALAPVLPQADAQAVRQYFAPLDALLVEDGQAGLNLAGANESMGAVSGYLARLLSNDNREETVFKALMEIADNQDDTLKRLDIASRKLPAEVAQWYSVLIDGVVDDMSNIAADNLDRVYKIEVVRVYNETLRGYFPFNRRSDRDVNLGDFTNFFRSGGVVESFQARYLSPFIGPDGALKTVMGRPLPISPQAVGQLQRAYLVRDAFFAGGGNPSVNYQIEPSTMDDRLKTSTLRVDGKELSYWHGPIMGEGFHWPGGRGAFVAVEDLNGLVQERGSKGEWAIFRLLQGASRTGPNNSRTLEVKINNYWVRYVVQIGNRANPFDPGISTYAPPPSLKRAPQRQSQTAPPPAAAGDKKARGAAK